MRFENERGCDVAFACSHCGKIIKGTVKHTNPPLFLVKLGIDFPQAFHPKCYEACEAAAAVELGLTEKPTDPAKSKKS